ncbi:MAG: hypothetical protein R2860_16325 [Desulfobacterales bacterium]
MAAKKKENPEQADRAEGLALKLSAMRSPASAGNHHKHRKYIQKKRQLEQLARGT